MKTIVETFVYQVPDDCDDYLTIQDYVEAAKYETCPFYDNDYSYHPETLKREIVEI